MSPSTDCQLVVQDAILWLKDEFTSSDFYEPREESGW
jgi:hypothetical protein